jgi:NAD dependent epimerase/dehydratase family enzyme
MRLLFGEMADVLLKGTSASNQKIIKTGFTFQYRMLNDAVIDILGMKTK